MIQIKRIWPLLAIACCVLADTDEDSMEGMGDRVEFHPINAGSKTFHWICSLALLLVLPSVSSVLAFADRLHWSLVFQFVSTAYSVFESLFLDFPDNNNHENRTSKGTSWFLSILFGATVFIGSLINGSNMVINKFYPHLGSKSLTGWSYKAYKALSVLVVLTGWVRVCMAPVALFGFCYGKHTGQCIAHGIMGLAFVGYSFVLSLVLVIPWIRKHHLVDNSNPNVKSQEFYDSFLMCIWGIVNTFTEHRWGTEDWSMGDYQHTAMGIIWWAGGLLGIFLARKRNRTFIPALLLIFTGWSMSQHVQHLQISTKVHGVFGIALMAAGVSRIIEILMLLKDAPCSENGNILAFQYLPPFCLTLSGIMFMAANEEQLILVSQLGSDHSAYVLVVSAAAFTIYLWLLLLLTFYLKLVGYDFDGRLGFESDYDQVGSNVAEEFELGDLSDEEREQS
ncbi:uncharacterized protein PRCAT00004793001 [Priceomyces carsonii]|uniref:uncharacterized protein n=1 Tax=Priceomyces carsonii TaxID=28549 RepID=UPI002ED83A50|nr:unnamed protein product [Priceomyces carsonii]